MSLFKILKGAQTNLTDQVVHEGWAYFTEDTGNFYIDTSSQRIQINPKSKSYEIVIDPSEWSSERMPTSGFFEVSTTLSGTSMTDPYNSVNYNGVLGLPDDVVAHEVAEFAYAQVQALSFSDKTLVLGALRKPTASLHMMLTLIPRENALITNLGLTNGDGVAY